MKTVASVNTRVDDGQTSQGFYVASAGGTAFGFNNNRSVERVLGFMADGLKKFKSAPQEELDLELLSFAPLAPPTGSAVLRVYSRILPAPEGCADSNKNLQRDHLWILPDEIRALERGEVSEALQLRLCRFTFVDAVRGEPDFWAVAQIASKNFDVKDGRITGSFTMANGKQSLQGKFEAEYKARDGKLVEFRGFADCIASGSGTYTPAAPEGKFPLKFAFVVAPDTYDTVAPQAAMYGREYLAGR